MQSQQNELRNLILKVDFSFSNLFDWIIAQINQILSVDETSRSDDARERPVRSLGLLDLFGFESFARNDIEQLLINMANEALQVKL